MTTNKPYVHFVDFDQPDEFDEIEKWSRSLDSLNFVLDFNNTSASCARDLDAAAISDILDKRSTRQSKDHRCGTRWINVWKPEEQAPLIRRIGKRYGFSARLQASMCSPQITCDTPTEDHQHSHRDLNDFMGEFLKPWRSHKKHSSKLIRSSARSMSKASDISSIEDDGVPSLGGFNLNHYRIVNDVWHYSSIDWGKDYLCIGFNSLYRVDKEIEVDSYKPAGKRVWTWLVLCDDGTVLSIHENPFPNQKEPVQHSQRRVIMAIRRNLRNVFRQLSRGFDNARLQNTLETIKLRSNMETQDGSEVPDVVEDDAPSLLFYYLFDDWFTSYSLVARREHQYGVELDVLRDSMFGRAELEHVSRLHHYGRQLAVLKRIYRSYDTIIQRILDGPQPGFRQKAIAMQDSDFTDRASSSALLADFRVGAPGEYGVSIATAASVRFRRLRDRINMYCIGEIQDCIEEKASLMELNFNLITLKESSYIEGLTRITILLAKVTIVFIPVTFMSSYFAIEFQTSDGPIGYTPTQYWIAFAVIFVFSITGLTMFGKLSGTQEGKPIYESFSSLAYRTWMHVWRKTQDYDTKPKTPKEQIQLRALST